VVLATRGQRETDAGGVEPVPDPDAAYQLRCQAQRVHLHALAFAALCTAIMLGIDQIGSVARY
jgi:hypothetical protein